MVYIKFHFLSLDNKDSSWKVEWNKDSLNINSKGGKSTSELTTVSGYILTWLVSHGHKTSLWIVVLAVGGVE